MNRRKKPTNVAGSVRGRLLNLARERGEDFQFVLSSFANERFLYRLSISPHAESFVLKGAMLLRLWSADRYRATWDLDLLGRGARSVDAVVTTVRDLCGIAHDDGIVFDGTSIVASELRGMDEYAGARIQLAAHLAGAGIPMRVDVGFGDAIIPTPYQETYPALLDHPPPRILVYPREAVIAEKLEAMVTLGVTNSRVKDFYDVYQLAMSSAFDGATLAKAIRATFERRRTPLPEPQPLVLSRSFLTTAERRVLWRAFWRRSRVEESPESVERVADTLERFLGPLLGALAQLPHCSERDAVFSSTYGAVSSL